MSPSAQEVAVAQARAWVKEHEHELDYDALEEYFPQDEPRQPTAAVCVGSAKPRTLPSGELEVGESTRWFNNQRLFRIFGYFDSLTQFEEAAYPTPKRQTRAETPRRKNHPRVRLLIAPAVEPEELARAETLARDVQAVLDRIPAASRELLMQRFFDRRTLKDIAGESGISYQAVQGRLRRAVANFKEEWLTRRDPDAATLTTASMARYLRRSPQRVGQLAKTKPGWLPRKRRGRNVWKPSQRDSMCRSLPDCERLRGLLSA